MMMAESRLHIGPLPAPADLAQYEQACPGAAASIMEEWRLETKHRHDCDRQQLVHTGKLVDSQTYAQKYGVWFGFIIAMSSLLLAGIIGLYGQPWAAAALGGVSISGLVSVFVLGRRQQASRQKQDDER